MKRLQVTDPQGLLALLFAALIVFLFGWTGLSHGAEATKPSSTLAALHRLPVHVTDKDEAKESRDARLVELYVSIDGATSNLDERAWLITTAEKESGLARYVTEDDARCREGEGGRCDSGRAFGAWQLHGMKRTESKLDQAKAAIASFRKGANYCVARGLDHWIGGTSHYARGWGCSWKHAKARVARMLVIRGWL